MGHKEKVCLTTYIYGIAYQAYIPFLVYSCHKSYPEYDIRLYLYDNLDENVKLQLEIIGADNVEIIERQFSDCPNMSPLKAKSLRWIIWDDVFINYDYIYVVDIDMLYIKEDKPLHLQHIEHMKTTGLPYDNIARCFTRNPFRVKSLVQRYRHARLHNIFRFLFGSKSDYRASGLHFIEVKRYYKALTQEYRNKYLKEIYDGSYIDSIMSCNNETLLYSILQNVGLHPEKMAIQTKSDIMLDFHNTTRAEFRPHHGIHLGIFRQQWEPGTKGILESNTYKYYAKIFCQEVITDNLFWTIYETSPKYVQIQIDRLMYYYQFKQPNIL